MGSDERTTNDMIKTDAFARRMPSHRGQKTERRRPEAASLKEEPAVKEEAAIEPAALETAPEIETEAFEAVPVQAEEESFVSAPADEEETEAVGTEESSTEEPKPLDGIEVPSGQPEASEEEASEEEASEEPSEEAETVPETDTDTARDAAALKAKPVKKSFDFKKNAFTEFVKKHKQLSAILLTVLLLIIVLIILAATGGGRRKSDGYMDQIRNQEIKLNDVAAIDDFFVTYYTSLSSGNTTELEAMFDDPAKANITTEISTIVNQYDNFKVYVTPGIEENDIVAFVSNDIHFANIEATAPSVDSFYLKYDKEAAALKICSDMYTDQNILKYMNLVSYREPIRSLLTDTNNRLSDALAGNKDLNNLYILMQSMTESAEQLPAAEETTAEE